MAERDLEAARQASVAQLLFRCARLLNEQAIAHMQQHSGAARLRTAHTRLFPYIDQHGVRPSVLAEHLGISRQAVGKLTTELVELGILELVADPDDGRARRVRFSAQEGRTLLDGLALLRAFEQERLAPLGAADQRELHRLLLRLEGILVAGDQQPAPG